MPEVLLFLERLEESHSLGDGPWACVGPDVSQFTTHTDPIFTPPPYLYWTCSADTTGTPCAECALHDRECVIDEFADKRRKVAAKRAQEDLKYYRGFVEQLLEALRSSDCATIDGILDVIRSGATHDEIRAVLARSAPKAEINIPDGVDSVVTDGNNSPPASSKPDGLPE
ncbi:hypothetical protein CBS13152_9230 [Aspergillus niger]|nr:hypothetical protein CBS13152_9230 [Aspergillus niger]